MKNVCKTNKRGETVCACVSERVRQKCMCRCAIRICNEGIYRREKVSEREREREPEKGEKL